MAMGDERREKKRNALGADAYVGWRTRLLACLADSLETAKPTERGPSLQLAIIARIPLSPNCGSNGHCRRIAEKLAEYLNGVSIVTLSMDVHRSDMHVLLSDLDCERCSEGKHDDGGINLNRRCYEEGNDKRTNDHTVCNKKITRKTRRNTMIIRDNIFHVDRDGFALEEAGKEEQTVPNGAQTDAIQVATLEIMYSKVVGCSPGSISEFETFVRSVSVFSRLVDDVGIYGDVLKHLLESDFSVTDQNRTAAAWELVLTALLRGSLNFWRDAYEMTDFRFQTVLLESVLCFAKTMADRLNSFMHSDDLHFELSADIRHYFFDCVIQYCRLLITVLDIVALPLKSKCSRERVHFISNGLLVCRKQQYVTLARELFIFIECLLPSDSLITGAASQFCKFLVHFSNRILLLKSRPQLGAKYDDHEMSEKKLSDSEQRRCVYVFVHDIIMEITRNTSEKVILSEVLSCALSLPDEYYSSVDVASLFATYLSDHFMDQCVGLFAEQMHNFDRKNIKSLPEAFIVSLERRIVLPMNDVETVSLAVLKRFKIESPPSEWSKGDTVVGARLGDVSAECNAMADFLAEHLAGEEAVEFAVRELVLPTMGLVETSAASFGLIHNICRRCILIQNELTECKMIEELAKSLDVRLGRELTFACADIWTLIAAADFAIPILYVTDLLLLLLTSCREKELPNWFVKHAGQYSLAFMDIALDWMQAPSDAYSHILRISQLFAVSLQIAIATNVAEKKLLEQMQCKLLGIEPLISNIRLLECFVRIFLLVTYSSLPSKSVPESLGVGKFLWQISATSIKLLQMHLQKSHNVSSYYICKICSMLRFTLRSIKLCENHRVTLFGELKPLVVCLLQLLSEKSISSNCFLIALTLYFDLASTNFAPSDFRNIFAVTKKAGHLQVAFLEIMLKLLQAEKVEPKQIYVFPQKAYTDTVFVPEDTVAAQKWATLHEPIQFGKSLSAPANEFPGFSSSQLPSKHSNDRGLCASLTDLTTYGKCEQYRLDPCCAAQLTLKRMLFLTDGLSASFWLRIRKYPEKDSLNSDGERLLHSVCSLGTNGVCFLLQLLSSYGRHALQMSIIMNGKRVRRRCLRTVLPEHEWNHIVLSLIIVESVCSASHFTMRTKYGSRKPPEQLPFVFGFGALQKDLMLTEAVYELTPIIAFKGRLKAEQVLILRALGSDCISLAACNISALMLRLTSLLSATDAFYRESSLLALLSDVATAYARLHHSVLFSVRDSLAYMHWKFNSRNSTESAEHGHLPPAEMNPLDWNCPVAVKQLCSSTVNDCLLSLGAQNLFIFIFARAIDVGHSEYEQAIAMRLMLLVLQRVSPFLAEYTLANVYGCIIRCLSSPLTQLGALMLEEFRVACIAPPPTAGCSFENNAKEALIVKPELIVSLICAPQIWRGPARMSEWCQILKHIAQCISEGTAECCCFNREQLKRLNFLRKFFHAILEMLHDDKNYAIGSQEEAATTLAETQSSIISVMVGAPAGLDEIVQLWNFIFLSHPAAHTYITFGYTDHFQWLQREIQRVGNEFDSSKDSELVLCLKDYINILGKDRIAEIWAKERSTMKVRQIFEAARADNRSRGQQTDYMFDDTNLMNSVSDREADKVRATDECFGKEPHRENENEAHLDGSWFADLRCRCLEQLTSIIQNAPDASVGEAVNVRISWQAAITLLTNQRNQRFRNQLFGLLKHILLRAGPDIRVDFMKNGGFELFSNQLKGYPATDELASSLFSMLFEKAVQFSDGLDPISLKSLRVNRFKCLSLKTIFTLWEESVCHSSLSVFWNISSALTMMFTENEMLMQAMMDVDLCSTMVSVLRRIALLPSVRTDLAHVSTTTPFMECWFSMVKRIIRVCVPYRNAHLYELCRKLLELLEMAVLQADIESERITRQGLACVLGVWLSVLQDVYLDEVFRCNVWQNLCILRFFSYKSARNPENESSPSSIVYIAETNDADDDRWAFAEQRGTLSPGSGNSLAGTFSTIRETVADLREYMKCSYKRTYSKCLPSADERTERLVYCLREILHFFTALPMKSPAAITNQEKRLFEIFLSFLITVWKPENAGSVTVFERLTNKQRLMKACRDRAALLFGPLITFVLFPASTKVTRLARTNTAHTPTGCNDEKNDWEMKKRLMVVKLLLSNKSNLKLLLDVNLEYQCALNLSLHELALIGCVEDENIQKDVENLIKFLRSFQIESPLATLNAERLASLNTDESLAIHGYLEYQNKFLDNMQQKAVQYINAEKKRAKNRSEAAMRMTCRVVEEQNALRKTFMKWCRDTEMKNIAADRFLDDLVTQLCHPEGVSHDPESWPCSWALDPTEGPNRERRRLMCSHLTFDTKFLLPQSRDKIRTREKSPPLFNLLSSLRRDIKRWGLVDGLAPGERIIVSLPAAVVRSTVESRGEILAGDKKFYFHSDHTRSIQKGLSRVNTLFFAWSYEDLVGIYKRHHLLEDTAMEIFLSDGQTYLIVFDEPRMRDQFASQILSSELCKLTTFSSMSIQSTSQLWREGTITNFEYLMQLNKLAGRSYNDLMQYPVFPFVLSDYKSNFLDLADTTSFRDLSRPMAVQNKTTEQYYLRKYSYLEHEAARAVPGCGSPFIFGPYHYGSHYSNIGIVAHYLVRLPPFTDIALEYQDNSFDIADRLFNSVETTWRLASFDSTTDFKELIPEFFYLPDFLMNNEGLNLGVRQNGDIVNDVVLPAWCQGSPRLFVLVNRQALESPAATSTLNHWIDLIFGYKQTGKAAIDAINVFHPATYRANTMNSVSEEPDEISLSALRTMVQTYGQMPLQLFQSPHLPHLHDKALQHSDSHRSSPSPLDTVKGIRWGEFIGSPVTEFGNLVIVLDEKPYVSNRRPIGRIVAFADGICFAFPTDTCLIYKYVEGVRPRELCSYGLLTWRHNDGILRLRLRKPKLWWNLGSFHSYRVTATAFCVSFDLLFVGFSCGILRAYRIFLCEFGIKDFVLMKTLYAHDYAISALAVCGDFAIAASGCEQGKICIWDLNRMLYVRTLVQDSGRETQLICISRTSCDIAAVTRSGYGSCITLYTVNGLKIGSVETDITVTAVAMTSLPEGTAVNCLFLGMQNGVIRIFDMWTMKAVRDIIDYRFLEPVVSMSFSNRCARLFVCLSSGRILCWQGENFQPKRPPVLEIITDTLMATVESTARLIQRFFPRLRFDQTFNTDCCCYWGDKKLMNTHAVSASLL